MNSFSAISHYSQKAPCDFSSAIVIGFRITPKIAHHLFSGSVSVRMSFPEEELTIEEVHKKPGRQEQYPYADNVTLSQKALRIVCVI
jgi:hypothetical protein